MKVRFDDMTERERVVITKKQLLDFIERCTFDVVGSFNGVAGCDVNTPPIIEVEEVMG